MRTIPLPETNPATEGRLHGFFYAQHAKIRTSNRPDLSLKAKEYLVCLVTNYLW